MKRVYILVVMLFLASSTLAQNVVVGSVRMDAANHLAYIQITNKSNRVVTGFSVSLTEVYSNGHTVNHSYDEDFGPYAEARGKALNPGQDKFVEDRFGTPIGVSVVDVKAKVASVIYADLSSEGKPEGIDRIATVRRGEAMAFAHSAQAMESALSDPSEMHPATKAAENIKAGKTPDVDSAYLSNAATNLEAISQEAQLSNLDERQLVQKHLTSVKQKADLYTKFASIRRPQ
jgi:hypothetical protein